MASVPTATITATVLRSLLLLRHQANHPFGLTTEPARVSRDPDFPAEDMEVLWRRAEEIIEAILRVPPAFNVVVVHQLLAYFSEYIGEEMPFRIVESLLHHHVVDVLAKRILLVRGHLVQRS